MPRIEDLKVERRVVEAADLEEGVVGRCLASHLVHIYLHWPLSERFAAGFAEGMLEPRYIPVELSAPHSRLTGPSHVLHSVVSTVISLIIF